MTEAGESAKASFASVSPIEVSSKTFRFKAERFLRWCKKQPKAKTQVRQILAK